MYLYLQRMSLYINPDNQTLLWTIIHKNQPAQHFFQKISPAQKENWFKSIIQHIYNQNKSRTLTIPELQQLNRDTLSYMLNNIREQETPTTTIKNTPQAVPLSSVAENKQTLINQQFSVRQKEYELMNEKKAPENINFSDSIADQPISNMDELIRTHMKQREEELHIYAPQQNIIPPSHPLKIDSANVELTVESIEVNKEVGDAKIKKSVSWSETDTNVSRVLYEQYNMFYAEFESYRLMVREMSNKIKVLEEDIILVKNKT